MIRLITFATAFLLGVFITSAAGPASDTHDCIPPVIEQKPAQQISVEYAGWDYEAEFPRIRIRVTNGLSNTISHFAHSMESPFAQITRNGEKVLLFHCGTGAKNHILYPGSTLNASLGIYELGREPISSSDTFTVGYYFKIAEMENPILITSEPFELPANLRAAITEAQNKTH